jgi:hypothetical protein
MRKIFIKSSIIVLAILLLLPIMLKSDITKESNGVVLLREHLEDYNLPGGGLFIYWIGEFHNYSDESKRIIIRAELLDKDDNAICIRTIEDDDDGNPLILGADKTGTLELKHFFSPQTRRGAVGIQHFFKAVDVEEPRKHLPNTI